METGSSKEITKLHELTYELKVGDAMSRKLITVLPDTTMNEFREMLRANRISGTPVLSPEGKMVGIVSIEDLIKALAAGRADSDINSGRRPYLAGLKKELCVPKRKSPPMSNGMFFKNNPVKRRATTAKSMVLNTTTTRALLQRSAKRPAPKAKRRKGHKLARRTSKS